jgi:hypothetical protein
VANDIGLKKIAGKKSTRTSPKAQILKITQASNSLTMSAFTFKTEVKAAFFTLIGKFNLTALSRSLKMTTVKMC